MLTDSPLDSRRLGKRYIPSELAYGDSGQGGDIKGGDVLVFTLHMIKINGAGKPAESRGPPPYTVLGDGTGELSYDAWIASTRAACVDTCPPKVLAVLRQPVGGSKVFLGFKAAARQSAKAAGGSMYAMTANSYFEKGKYTTDALAHALALTAPAVYLQAAGATGWTKCETGRPTDTTQEAIQQAVASCVVAAAATVGVKAEL